MRDGAPRWPTRFIGNVSQRMEAVPNEAARLPLLHDIGAVSSAEIVSWGDDFIVSEENPSQELIELSSSSGRMVGHALRVLSLSGRPQTSRTTVLKS